MQFTETQIRRYARHIILPEVGGTGQARLLAARVLVVGAGGLGAPLLQYLAAAGVGTIGIADGDTVDLSNLQRQVIHDTARVGAPKVHSAADAIARINPEVRVEAHAKHLDATTAGDLVGRYDLVADGTDSFETRYLLNDACFFAGVPLVSASLFRFEAQVSTFKPHMRVRGGATGHPCYRCLWPRKPAPGSVPSCAEAGVFGALAGLAGCLQATEVLKELLGIGEGLSGRLLMIDALTMAVQTLTLAPDPECPLCGHTPTLTDLSGHG